MNDTGPNAGYRASLASAPKPAKPKRRVILWVVGGVAAAGLLIGATQQGGTPAPAPIAVPSATSETTRDSVPASCITALQKADESLTVADRIRTLAGEGFDAVARGDAAELRRIATRIQNQQALLSDRQAEYRTARDECRRANTP